MPEQAEAMDQAGEPACWVSMDPAEEGDVGRPTAQLAGQAPAAQLELGEPDLEPRPASLPGGQQQAVWPALTPEALLYAALIVGAAFIRLYDLARWPLLTDEATQALAAWRFLHGQGAGSGSAPFLFGSALLSFFAFGANDATARLVPALLGTGLVLVPLALRRHLGTWGALAATFLLAFSPTTVFYSRALAGPMPALAGLGAILVAIELAAREEVRWARVAGVAGLAVALTSSPWAYTFLLAGLLFLGLGWAAGRRRVGRPGWAVDSALLRSIAGDRRAWAGLAALVLPLSTAFLLNPGGLQGTADLLAAWLGRLVPGAGGSAWAYPLTILTFYEAGLLVLGLAGLAVGLRRGSPWAGFLGLWAGLAALQATLAGARDAAPVAFAVLPLALLGGLAVNSVIGRLEQAQWIWAGACLAVLSVLAGLWWLKSAAFTNPDPAVSRYGHTWEVGLVVALTPLVLAAAVLVFWYWVGRSETVWALTIFGLGLVGCLVLRSSVSLNFTTGRDAREPMVAAPTSRDIRDLPSFLEDYSVRRVGDQHELAIEADAALEPLVPWYLRDFPALRISPVPLLDGQAGALVLTAQPEGGGPKGYVRTHYFLRQSSSAPLGDARQAVAWWLMRAGGGSVQAETCELWVKP